jgi:hypothetical protein
MRRGLECTTPASISGLCLIVSYGAPNVVTIELFSGKFMGMLVDASRTTGLCSICTLKVAMLIRRRTALIVTGIAAMLLLALVFLYPHFLTWIVTGPR